jgi:hypothetical protein
VREIIDRQSAIAAEPAFKDIHDIFNFEFFTTVSIGSACNDKLGASQFFHCRHACETFKFFIRQIFDGKPQRP